LRQAGLLTGYIGSNQPLSPRTLRSPLLTRQTPGTHIPVGYCTDLKNKRKKAGPDVPYHCLRLRDANGNVIN